MNGNPFAQQMYNKSEAIELLTKKIGSYEKFVKEYPGFGGFLPWMSVDQG